MLAMLFTGLGADLSIFRLVEEVWVPRSWEFEFCGYAMDDTRLCMYLINN